MNTMNIKPASELVAMEIKTETKKLNFARDLQQLSMFKAYIERFAFNISTFINKITPENRPDIFVSRKFESILINDRANTLFGSDIVSDDGFVVAIRESLDRIFKEAGYTIEEVTRTNATGDIIVTLGW